jgi:hypothetical protein
MEALVQLLMLAANAMISCVVGLRTAFPRVHTQHLLSLTTCLLSRECAGCLHRAATRDRVAVVVVDITTLRQRARAPPVTAISCSVRHLREHCLQGAAVDGSFVSVADAR